MDSVHTGWERKAMNAPISDGSGDVILTVAFALDH